MFQNLGGTNINLMTASRPKTKYVQYPGVAFEGTALFLKKLEGGSN